MKNKTKITPNKEGMVLCNLFYVSIICHQQESSRNRRNKTKITPNKEGMVLCN